MRNLSFLVFWFLIALFSFSASNVLAITVEECESKVGKKELSLTDAKDCEAIFDKLYQEASSQKSSLQNEVKKFNSLISSTNARIDTTLKQIEALEQEISLLAGKINQLDASLNDLSEVLLKRIATTYKKGKVEPLTIFFSSKDFSEFVSRYKYLRVMQFHDRTLMLQMENSRTSFEDQKTIKEEKQTALEEAKKKLDSQKLLLAQQKADKENLLRITQNNEARYQQLLAASQAEIEAIQGIIAGKGIETEVGPVKEGDKIATIIAGSSACSTGTHLHFEIREKSDVKDPFSYLKDASLQDNSGGDPHTGSGSWEWPLNQPIKFNQGFGSNTAAIRAKLVWYSFHTGIDIVSDDKVVKAAKTGKLFRGSIACGGGVLRYVRLDHDDSELDTYYLHVNY